MEPSHNCQSLAGPAETRRSGDQEIRRWLEPKEKRAPIVKFRRSPAGAPGQQRSSLKHCSAIKARDISSCEISICDTASPPRQNSPNLGAKRHVSVSFGSLPSSCSEASSEAGETEDRILAMEAGLPKCHGRPASVLTPCDPCPGLLQLPRPSLCLQQSTDSADTATTTEEGGTQMPRRVSALLRYSL